MPVEDRLERIETKLTNLNQQVGGLMARIDGHVCGESGQLDRIEASVDRLKRLYTQVAILEDRHDSQRWWNRSFIITLFGLVSAWVATKIRW